MTSLPIPRLMCVDDNAELLRTLALGFRAFGFNVTTAAHGIDALMQFKGCAGNLAAILIDHDMRKMNGAALVRQLGALGYRGRILVMSGHWTADIYHLYADLPVNAFLQKPFEVGMVATLLMMTD